MNMYRKCIEINREILRNSYIITTILNVYRNIYRTTIKIYQYTIEILSNDHHILLLQIIIEIQSKSY